MEKEKPVNKQANKQTSKQIHKRTNESAMGQQIKVKQRYECIHAFQTTLLYFVNE